MENHVYERSREKDAETVTLNTGEQQKANDNGFTHTICVYCKKPFKYKNADPEYVESLSFCSDKCRSLHYWFVGKRKFEEMYETVKK